jgi:hypothetical protein
MHGEACLGLAVYIPGIAKIGRTSMEFWSGIIRCGCRSRSFAASSSESACKIE